MKRFCSDLIIYVAKLSMCICVDMIADGIEYEYNELKAKRNRSKFKIIPKEN